MYHGTLALEYDDAGYGFMNVCMYVATASNKLSGTNSTRLAGARQLQASTTTKLVTDYPSN